MTPVEWIVVAGCVRETVQPPHAWIKLQTTIQTTKQMFVKTLAYTTTY